MIEVTKLKFKIPKLDLHYLVLFQKTMATVTCGVPDCRERHASHYCRLCGCKTSTHYSIDCPKGVILYHGTRLSTIKKISYEGLRPSEKGRLGPGVYFTDSLQDAKDISSDKRFGQGKGGAVFECMVYLGRMKSLGRATGSMWQYENYDSAETIHPAWYGPKEFTEICLKDAKKCSVRKVMVTDGRVEGIESLGTCVITKVQIEWKLLRQLDDDPKFDDIRSISKTNSQETTSSSSVSLVPKTKFSMQFQHQNPRKNSPAFQPKVAMNFQHQNSPKIRAKSVQHMRVFCKKIRKKPRYVFITLKLILYLITFAVQLKSVVVQKHTCDNYTPAIISLSVFLSLLTLGRILYCFILCFIIQEIDEEDYYIFFCSTFGIVFFIEMPMMVSYAYVIKSCGTVEGWGLTLNIFYIGHLWLALIMNSAIVKLVVHGRKWYWKFLHDIFLPFFLPVVMYVPIHLKLSDRAYDFRLDANKISGSSSNVSTWIPIFLIYYGTIGWGVWCAFFAVFGIILIGYVIIIAIDLLC